MFITLDFKSAEITPEGEHEGMPFLILDHDGDYTVGRLYVDDDKKFICFITPAGPLHQHEYAMWVLLPDKRI